MRLKNFAPLALLAIVWLTATAEADEDAARCALRLVDDRGAQITESLTVCRDTLRREGRPDACFDVVPDDPLPEIDVTALSIEGEVHGPVTAVKPEKTEDGTCTVSVPRKADVTLSFDTEKTRQLEASFYRPAEDPELLRPALHVSLEGEKTIRVPAGAYVLSMTERGWAPDLWLLDAAPGSSHIFRFRQRDGWSVVLRTVADRDDTPVANAEVEVRTLPGFDEPGHTRPGEEPKPRTLVEGQSSGNGLAVFSGLRVPVAAATVEHQEFLNAEIPAFSSDVGTFRIFEARLHTGGSLAVRVLREGAAAVNARCELAPPERETVEPWDLGETLYETQADDLGVCRATAIRAGVYALKVSLPDGPDAFAIQPIAVHDGETSDPTVEMRPILVSGRVLRGERGISGYEVKFEREGPFDLEAPYYPAGKATTDDSGDYQITLWTPGRYLGQVSTTSTTVGNFRLVDLDGDETVDFRLATAELEGQVVDDSGAPRPEARLTVKTPNLYRGVVLDEDAHFLIAFPDESGKVEIEAVAPGFRRSEPIELMLDKDQKPEPITVVIRRRTLREGRVVLPSGQPAAGVTVSVHRFDPKRSAYPLERVVSDASGRIEIPLESGPLRLFYGGPGCALASLDLPGVESSADEEPPLIEIPCEPPSHIILRLLTDDPELRAGASILLRHGTVLIPPSVLEYHLQSLGLPATTDGQGQIGLVALAPGAYDVYHGSGTSYVNLQNGYEAGKLTSVTLGLATMIETEVTLDFHLEKTNWLPFSLN